MTVLIEARNVTEGHLVNYHQLEIAEMEAERAGHVSRERLASAGAASVRLRPAAPAKAELAEEDILEDAELPRLSYDEVMDARYPRLPSVTHAVVQLEPLLQLICCCDLQLSRALTCSLLQASSWYPGE